MARKSHDGEGQRPNAVNAVGEPGAATLGQLY